MSQDTNVQVQPTTLLGTIVVDTLPSTTEKIFRLPGGNAHPENVLSGKQFTTLVRYMVENFPPTMTFAEGCTRLRTEARLSPLQRDFSLAEFVIRQRRRQDANLEVTDAQSDLLATCAAALSGLTPHWDAQIQAKINACPTARREGILEIFNLALMHGRRADVDKAMTVFRVNFGTPTRQQPTFDSGLDVALEASVTSLSEF